MKVFFGKCARLPRELVILLIRGYQHTLSPDHGPLRHLYDYGYCKHHPTCSQYAIEQIEKRGVLFALPFIAKRVLSCNPWTKESPERTAEIMKKTS